MPKITMTRKELEVFAARSLGFHKGSLRRMSTLFLAQFLQMKLRGDHSIDQMAREVRCLEGRENVPRIMKRDSGPATRPQEWIIFQTHNGTKYYLTMASLNDGDHRINRRILDACDFDFPFLHRSSSAAPRQFGKAKRIKEADGS